MLKGTKQQARLCSCPRWCMILVDGIGTSGDRGCPALATRPSGLVFITRGRPPMYRDESVLVTLLVMVVWQVSPETLVK
jgi:hypothetical protein